MPVPGNKGLKIFCRDDCGFRNAVVTSAGRVVFRDGYADIPKRFILIISCRYKMQPAAEAMKEWLQDEGFEAYTEVETKKPKNIIDDDIVDHESGDIGGKDVLEAGGKEEAGVSLHQEEDSGP